MSDYERYKKDHPEMLKMAEEHLEELEQMAGKLNQAIVLLREYTELLAPVKEQHQHTDNECWHCKAIALVRRTGVYLEGGDESRKDQRVQREDGWNISS